MDLNTAIQKHAEWKFKFRNALLARAAMDANAISKDNNCEMGKWLHGDAAALYGNLPAYARCLANHAAFHVEAATVAKAVNALNKEDVERKRATGSAFSAASKKVGISIVELNIAIRS
jgi:methyl-accepting chemotaxis protein